MIRPSLRRGRGLASYYVTASLLWLAGIIAVTAPLAAGDLRAVVSGGARWPDPAPAAGRPGLLRDLRSRGGRDDYTHHRSGPGSGPARRPPRPSPPVFPRPPPSPGPPRPPPPL